MRKPREQDTVTAILQFLRAHRIPAWRITTGATTIGGRFLRFGVVGMADIIGILTMKIALEQAQEPKIIMPPASVRMSGFFLAIEVKSAKGKVSSSQQFFLNQVNAAGGRAFVARSVADVARELGL